MTKIKRSIQDLKVQSFVTALDNEQLQNVKGGIVTVKGRRVVYTSRWTTVDTRADLMDKINPGVGG